MPCGGEYHPSADIGTKQKTAVKGPVKEENKVGFRVILNPTPQDFMGKPTGSIQLAFQQHAGIDSNFHGHFKGTVTARVLLAEAVVKFPQVSIVTFATKPKEPVEQQDRGQFDSTNLIVYIYQWRKPLLILTLAAMVLAAVFSAPAFIKPRYKSTVVVFPSTTNSVSKALLPQQVASRAQDILEFGDEQQSDQLIQVLGSDEIRTRIIEKFNLVKHYDLDTTGPYVRTTLYKTYDSNIKFKRTEFMSVEITVLDTDPDTAAAIANTIVDYANEVRNRIQQERAKKGLRIIEAEYDGLKTEVTAMEEQLTELRFKKGIHDYETQSAVLNEQYATALIKDPGSPAVKELRARLDTLAKYGGAYVSIRDDLKLLKEELVKIKTKLDQAKVDVSETLPYTFVVNAAYPSERKAYPIRWLIVFISGLSTFVFTLVAILVLDTVRKRKA
jgi:uncharacterized protein involved in exopolysaccharide biosynthesis